jgi:hypothetical protein
MRGAFANTIAGMRGEERREFQRLQLDPPIPGTFSATAVSIMEVGVLGSRIHHGEPLGAESGELRFSHYGDEIAMKCEVVRTMDSQQAKYPGSGLESGIRFVAAIDDSGDRLRTMLADMVSKELNLRRNTPIDSKPIDGDNTVRGTDAQFLSYRFENGIWKRRRIFLPEQPANGFTVARLEDSEEMQRLCRVYQASDAEGQRLIRLFAELSVSDALEIPPRA